VYENLSTNSTDPLVYIQWMKFAQRTEGTKAARNVSKLGRKSPSATWHIYVASALIEWKMNKDVQVARSLFDWGMNKFVNEPDFVLEYIKFLSHLNEENNLRVLFERAVAQIPIEKAKMIWNHYVDFEHEYGDLNSITKIEKRKTSLYSSNDPSGVLSLVQRYKYMDLWPISTSDLDSFAKLPIELNSEPKTDAEDLLLNSKSNAKLSKLPKPDLSMMVLYTPDASTPSPYGVIPEAISNFLSVLPLPENYKGPVPDIDQLMRLLEEVPLPIASLMQENPLLNVPNKNKRNKEDEEEDNDNTQTNMPPAFDLFRQRQAAKLRKIS